MRTEPSRRGGVVVAAVLLRLALPALGLSGLVGCAVPPSIAGAPCPCPGGYECDADRNVCVSSSGLGDPPTSTPPSTAAPSPPGGDPPSAPPPACTVGAAPPSPVTPTEYRFAVADLFGLELARTEVPAEVDGLTGFAIAVDSATTTQGLRDLAQIVASRAVTAIGRPKACDGLSDAACGGAYIETLGKRAYRRPLAASERDALAAAFANGYTGGGLTGGLGAVIAKVLASDSFLRRRDVARAGASSAGTPSRLDAPSIAARLALLLWRSVPDDALVAAADSGALLDPDEIERQATRMLLDPRAERMLIGFFRDWLDVDEDQILAPPTDLPALTPGLKASILRSFDAYASDVVFRQDAPIATLFTATELLSDQAMASFYGLAPVGAGLKNVAPGPGQIRRGVLTSPARLANRSDAAATNPVRRGVEILAKVMCSPTPDPPPGLAVVPPQPGVATTSRERYDLHRQPACASCHSIIDPLGLALENYDQVGRWRTSENSETIDPAGKIQSLAATIPPLSFSGPAELADQLATAPFARTCFATQWFRYFFARVDDTADACTIAAIDKAFQEGGGRTRGLLLALTRTAAFTSLPPAASK